MARCEWRCWVLKQDACHEGQLVGKQGRGSLHCLLALVLLHDWLARLLMTTTSRPTTHACCCYCCCCDTMIRCSSKFNRYHYSRHVNNMPLYAMAAAWQQPYPCACRLPSTRLSVGPLKSQQ